MDSRRFVLVVGGTILFAGAAYACGGKIETDPSDTGSAKSQGTDEDVLDGKKKKKERDPVLTPPPPPDAPTTKPQPPPRPACEYAGGSSSGGGDETTYKCQSVSFYECGGGSKQSEISCSCVSTNGVWEKGQCDCNGDSFAYDCAKGCQPGPEVYARCNLPPPYGGGTSGGSSSGG